MGEVVNPPISLSMYLTCPCTVVPDEGSIALREELSRLRKCLSAEKDENSRLKMVVEHGEDNDDTPSGTPWDMGVPDIVNVHEDYDTQLENYQKWLDSLKIVGEDGQLKNLDPTDRLALMERSVIKQSQVVVIALSACVGKGHPE